MKKYLSNYYLLLLFLSLWIGLVSCSEEKTTDSILSPPEWIHGIWVSEDELPISYVFTADNLEINGVSVRQNVINISDEERDEFGKTVYFISLYRHDHYETWTFTQDTVNTISLENYMSIGDIDDPTIIEDSDTLIKQPN